MNKDDKNNLISSPKLPPKRTPPTFMNRSEPPDLPGTTQVLSRRKRFENADPKRLPNQSLPPSTSDFPLLNYAAVVTKTFRPQSTPKFTRREIKQNEDQERRNITTRSGFQIFERTNNGLRGTVPFQTLEQTTTPRRDTRRPPELQTCKECGRIAPKPRAPFGISRDVRVKTCPRPGMRDTSTLANSYPCGDPSCGNTAGWSKYFS